MGQRPVELTKGKWNDIVRWKQNFQPNRSVPFSFDWNFDYFSVKWDWKREFLKMERQVSFGPDRPVKEDHLCMKVDHFLRKISTWTEAFHLCFDRNSRKFWHKGKHPFKLIKLWSQWHLNSTFLASYKWTPLSRDPQLWSYPHIHNTFLTSFKGPFLHGRRVILLEG